MSATILIHDEKYDLILGEDITYHGRIPIKKPARLADFRHIGEYKVLEEIEHPRREPFWKEGKTISFDVNAVPRNCFFPIEFEGEQYLIGITEDEKLVMYLVPEKTR